MPKHKPIKFESTLEPSTKKLLQKIIRDNPKAKTILNAALGIVAMGGILTFGAVFPALLGEIGKIKARQKRESYKKYQKIWRSFNYLKQKRALNFIEEKEGYLIYKPNKKGKEKIKKFIFDELKIEKAKDWDEKWRLVIFDIPEKYKKNRNALRNKLIDLGFYQCQKSAWIYPFPCEEEIEFTKQILNIKPFVKLFTIDEMDDGRVLYHFKNLLKESIVK